MKNVELDVRYWLDKSQVYIPKRHTLIQVLPPANAYTKSAHAYIHFLHLPIYA